MTTGEHSQSAAVLELFADDYSREILLAADETPSEHKQRFETTIETLHVAISDGELELSVEKRDELADNFTTLWNNFRENI
jgi:hypothetical protein